MVRSVLVGASCFALASAGTWEQFKTKFGKVYNGGEDSRHKATFEANQAFIAAENQKGHTYTLGETQFADLTAEEFKAYLGYKPALESQWGSLRHLGEHAYNGEELAASVDWRTKGAVTKVKNQGQCGSCWAFSTTGAMEGAWAISTGSLVSLSEQQLVDCSTENNGCQGGYMPKAFEFEEGVAVCKESSYPYTATDGTCKSGCEAGIPSGGISGYKNVQKDSVNSLKSALAVGPVSVAIEADESVFQHYTGGIISSGCGTNLDHGVLAVGYGDGYWIVKNSWGGSWGENGYLRISSTAGGSEGECGILMSASYPAVSALKAVQSLADPWESFKAKYGKTYNSVDEDAKHKAVFESNQAFIAAENAKGHTYTLGETQFADLTAEEFKAYLGFKPASKSPWGSLRYLGEHAYNGEELAASVDWRTKGAVTKVKDQGQCGSCWAFSSTGAMEGAWAISTGSLVSLSEQQLVDCSTENNGCQGGYMPKAFEFEEGVAVCKESSYPYTATDGTCKSGCQAGIPSGGISGYKNVQQDSANSLKSALAVGPVSVGIEADEPVFQHYTGGVISSGCGTNLDHGVLAVGYGDGYWIVKNSWGGSWGENGYLRISSTAGGSEGECGILMSASYPTVSAAVVV